MKVLIRCNMGHYFPVNKLLQLVFSKPIAEGTIEDSDILVESVFSNVTLLYSKKWLYTFLLIGESDRRLPIFMNDRLVNNSVKDYSCILKGEHSCNNIINFPLFAFYSYTYDFTYQFKQPHYDRTRWSPTIYNKITTVPLKNVCVIVSNGSDQEGRNYFFEELEKHVAIDYAGIYKNNVPIVKSEHCSPEFVKFVSQYKIIITMENSKNKTYITEKILHGFAAGTIPVYWGSDYVTDYFNKERFINVPSFNNDDIQSAITTIMDVLHNDDRYLEIVNKPIYVNNIVPFSLYNISTAIQEKLQIKNTENRHFITFGGPFPFLQHSLNRICEEAKTLDFFTKITGFNDIDLKNDKLFWEKHGDFINNNPRGYGNWLWKSYLIKKELATLNTDDILVYCDAGCQINANGKARLLEYIDLLHTDKNNYGLISFQLEYPEILYTKRKALDLFDGYNINTLQCLATVIIIKKTSHSIELINKWCELCNNYSLINDDIETEDPSFIEHRHDQSIFSLLVNTYGSIKLLDETYFYPNWDSDGKDYPFWATRIKR